MITVIQCQSCCLSVMSSTDSKLAGNPVPLHSHSPHKNQEEDSSLEEYLDTRTQENVLVNRRHNDWWVDSWCLHVHTFGVGQCMVEEDIGCVMGETSHMLVVGQETKIHMCL